MIAISILSTLVVILIYTNLNVLKKNEKCEDVIKTYENYITQLSNTIKYSDNKLKEIDRKGTFHSDDEVGFFFQELKSLQEQLNNFKIK